MTSIKTQRIHKKPRRLTKKCQFNRNPDLVTTLSLNVDSSKTFKKQEEAKSDVKIVESIVVSPKLFNIMRPWNSFEERMGFCLGKERSSSRCVHE